MNQINFLLDRFHSRPNDDAIVFQDNVVKYGELAISVSDSILWLTNQGVKNSTPVLVYGDYSPLAISILLALIELRCILIPITPLANEMLKGILIDAAPMCKVDVTGSEPIIEWYSKYKLPELYDTLAKRNVPGLVLFTSGSSGSPKAVVHDFSLLLKKFHSIRSSFITFNFLLFDHWGGLNTLLHSLSNLSLIVLPDKRNPEYVCDLIEKYKIQLLPATPTFLNMLLISKAYKGRNLSSLKLITYGAEPMSEVTLKNLRNIFPEIELRQTYGMIELGVLRTITRSPDSLWVKLGGEGYDIRVIDGVLQIKAESAMLGYLNAESPFTDDGYLVTGDIVEVDRDWIRILGRQSDIINVGGQKVYPAEVEEVILGCPEVVDTIVYGESNIIMGKIVCADVILSIKVDRTEAKKIIKRFCNEKLQPYMVPVKINFVDNLLLSNRLKRIRRKTN